MLYSLTVLLFFTRVSLSFGDKPLGEVLEKSQKLSCGRNLELHNSLDALSQCSSSLDQQHPLRLRKTFRREFIIIHAAWQIVTAELHRITSELQKLIYNDFNFSSHTSNFRPRRVTATPKIQ